MGYLDPLGRSLIDSEEFGSSLMRSKSSENARDENPSRIRTTIHGVAYTEPWNVKQ